MGGMQEPRAVVAGQVAAELSWGQLEARAPPLSALPGPGRGAACFLGVFS